MPSQEPLRGTSLPVRRTYRESLYLSRDACLWHMAIFFAVQHYGIKQRRPDINH